MMSPGDKSGVPQSDVAYVAQSLRRLRFHAINGAISPTVAYGYYGSHPAVLFRHSSEPELYSRLIPIDRQVICCWQMHSQRQAETGGFLSIADVKTITDHDRMIPRLAFDRFQCGQFGML